MKREITIVFLGVIAAGAFVLTHGERRGIPGDLRDAVSDAASFSTSIPEIDKAATDVPEPKPVEAVRLSLGMPYKTYDIVCEGNGQKLQLHWDMSKKPFLPVRALLNGVDEVHGLEIGYKKGSTIYVKRGVFLLSLPDNERDKSSFQTFAVIADKQVDLACTKSSKWHIFR